MLLRSIGRRINQMPLPHLVLHGQGAAGGFEFTLANDSLVWTSGVNVAVPVLEITIPEDVPSGYKIRGEVSANSDMSSPIETVSAEIAVGDLVDLQIDDFEFAALSDGLKYIQVWITDASDVQASNKSNIVSKTLDSTAPTITSAATANNAENSVLAHALTANESVTWSIVGGADAALFEISGSTLRWLSDGVQDFETPLDAGANNVYDVTVRATDTATNTTDQNIAVTVTDVDEVAPTLSSPTDTATGQTTADVGVDTNEANGTLYCVVTTSGTAPSAAQVKLGQDNSGVAATFADDQAIASTGTKAFSATGLTAATAYTAHFMHEDAVGNQSAVSSGNGFTTDSGSVAFDLSYVASPSPITPDNTVFTFSAAAIGVADSTRKTYVVIHSRQTDAGNGGVPSVASVTADAGAITGSEVVASEAVGVGCWIWVLDTPTDTAKDIVVTFSLTQIRCGIDVYRGIGTSLATSDTQHSETVVGGTDVTTTPVIPSGGAAIIAWTPSNVGGATTSWTNATEDADYNLESGNTNASCARRSTAGSTAVTARSSTGITVAAMAAAALAG